MTKETLSDNIDGWLKDYNDMGEEWQIPEDNFDVLKDYVKEYIKKLNEMKFYNTCKCESCKDRQWVIDVKEIDKLAGPALIHNPDEDSRNRRSLFRSRHQDTPEGANTSGTSDSCANCGHERISHSRPDGSCVEGTCYANFKCCKKFRAKSK